MKVSCSQRSERVDLKGVLIDFGDTLVYADEEAHRGYVEGLLSILRRYGYQKNLKDLDSLLGNAYFNSSKGETKDFLEFWELLLKDLQLPREPALIEDLEEFRNRRCISMFRLCGGAIPVLSALRKKYKLALVSNCAIGLSEVIRALGLASFFECIALSYELGVRKPDKRIYLEALRRINLEPSECVFVSDEISDLEGAREVGLKTLLVRQESHTTHEAKDPNFKPDFQCNDLSEITRFL